MKIKKIQVELISLSDILFHKFIDHSKEKRPPEQLLYLDQDNNVVLPQSNIRSFLFRENSPAGCAKTFEGKKGKEYIRVGQGKIFIEESIIPFMEKNKPIKFTGFKNKFYILEEAGVTKGSGSNVIKQEITPRPVMKHPWSLFFTISIIENVLIDENKLYNWFMAGGLQITLGSYRPVFGKFTVNNWNIIE